jgi:nucleoside-diphosphate-sugar epimerase
MSVKPTELPAGSLLVTGATGFLGRHVLEAVASRYPERRVYVLVRGVADWERLDYARQYPQVIPLAGDVTVPAAWIDHPGLVDLAGILHLAAIVRHSRRDPAPTFEANVQGTLNLVALAGRRKSRMVFVSTSGTVACHLEAGTRVEEDAPYRDHVVGSWPYYASKIEAERRARPLAAELGVPLVIMRPPILLGPGDHRFRSTGHVIRHMKRGFPFLIRGGLSFCDIRDAAAAIVEALGHPAARPIYHLQGHDFTIDEFFGLLEAMTGVPATRRYLPMPVARGVAAAVESLAHRLGRHSPIPDPVIMEMGSHHWDIGSRHAETELGYRSRPARETLQDTIDWLKAHHPALAVGGPPVPHH